MVHKSRLAQYVFSIIVVACVAIGSPAVAGDKRAPAGQMCLKGSFVIGFDSESNIICSEGGENGVLNVVETSDGGKAEIGDDCTGSCQSEEVDTKGVDEEIAANNIPTDAGIIPSTPELTISDVEPSSVLFGTRAVEITVSGTGFLAGSVIVVAGRKYPPSVNQAGTRLVVTINTRNLSIGPYAVTVSNGPGVENTLKKALEIY